MGLLVGVEWFGLDGRKKDAEGKIPLAWVDEVLKFGREGEFRDRAADWDGPATGTGDFGEGGGSGGCDKESRVGVDGADIDYKSAVIVVV